MEEIKESLLKKKLDSCWGSELKDFKAENELMVTITLNEYRDLIKKNVTAENRIAEAEKDKYRRNEENEKMKKENKELEMKLFEYRKLYGELEQENNEEE